MNRQNFFIQQLGIGPIWRLSDRATDNLVHVNSPQAHRNLVSDTAVNTHSNDISDLNKSSVDVLILRFVKKINHSISSQASQETELLFERLLQAFQLNSKMSMTVQSINESNSREELEKIIQSSPAKVLAVFGVEIARKLLNSESYSLDDTRSKDISTFNQYPLFVFHSPEEILKNTLLKKTTWEKMCTLKSNLH